MTQETKEKPKIKLPTLFDGSMGTWYAQQYGSAEGVEQASITHPRRIIRIHEDYIRAGAQAILTNTFQTEQEDVLRAAADNARKAVKNTAAANVQIWGDIGPVSESRPSRYIRKAKILQQAGITHFLFETMPDFTGIKEAAREIKEANQNSIVAVSFSAAEDGFTSAGLKLEDLLAQADADENIDIIGLNCMLGPKDMATLANRIETDKPVLIRPNAGIPVILANRAHYKSTPEYFARLTADLSCDAVGGCCGTSPAFIHELAKQIKDNPPRRKKSEKPDENKKEKPAAPPADKSSAHGPRPIFVEIDPPKDDDPARFLECVRAVKEAGADMITIADCPTGKARADSAMLAAKVQHEEGIRALPHITCRDRNRNAVKAILLALSIERVGQVLIVTGDPLPQEDRSEVRQVYNFNSRKLAAYIQTLKEEGLLKNMEIYGALNVNAPNFDVQLQIAKEKEAAGMTVFLTQPVLSRKGLENLKRAKRELRARIMGGIYPPVSQRNALFLQNEVNGIELDETIIELYKDKDRQQGEQLAKKITARLIQEMKDCVDGWYLMMPFTRKELAAAIIQQIRQTEKV